MDDSTVLSKRTWKDPRPEMATTTRYHSLARLFRVERLRHDEWRRRGRVNPAPKALDEYRFKLEDDTAPDARFFAEQTCSEAHTPPPRADTGWLTGQGRPLRFDYLHTDR